MPKQKTLTRTPPPLDVQRVVEAFTTLMQERRQQLLALRAPETWQTLSPVRQRVVQDLEADIDLLLNLVANHVYSIERKATHLAAFMQRTPEL